MRTFNAYLKKEWLEQLRTGRLTILAIIFVAFGIMSPAIAKMTPWMMKLLSESLSESGLTVTDVEITAFTSWTQFYKNISTALIIFVLLKFSCVTTEYQKGTLIPVLTKGLSRSKVILSKALMTVLLFIGCYFICFYTTYAYTAYYWDNSTVSHLYLGAFTYLLYGIWVISLIILSSSIFSTGTSVLLCTGGSVIFLKLIGMIPAIYKYLPEKLTQSLSLLNCEIKPSEMTFAVIITTILIIVNIIASVICFNRHML